MGLYLQGLLKERPGRVRADLGHQSRDLGERRRVHLVQLAGAARRDCRRTQGWGGHIVSVFESAHPAVSAR